MACNLQARVHHSYCSLASMHSVFAGSSSTASRFDASTISRWKGTLLYSDSEGLSYKSYLLSKHSHHNPNKPKAVRETDITDQRDDDRPIFQKMRRDYRQHIVLMFPRRLTCFIDRPSPETSSTWHRHRLIQRHKPQVLH